MDPWGEIEPIGIESTGSIGRSYLPFRGWWFENVSPRLPVSILGVLSPRMRGIVILRIFGVLPSLSRSRSLPFDSSSLSLSSAVPPRLSFSAPASFCRNSGTKESGSGRRAHFYDRLNVEITKCLPVPLLSRGYCKSSLDTDLTVSSADDGWEASRRSRLQDLASFICSTVI